MSGKLCDGCDLGPDCTGPCLCYLVRQRETERPASCSTCPSLARLRAIEEALEMFGDSNTSLDYVWEWVVDNTSAKTHADALLAWAAARKGAGR